MLYRVIIYSLLCGLIAFIMGYFGTGSTSWEWPVLGGWMLAVGLFVGTLELNFLKVTGRQSSESLLCG